MPLAHRPSPYRLFFSLLILLFALVACSSDDGPGTPAREPAYTATQVEEMIVTPQTERGELLDDLIAGGMDREAAADSVLQLFLDDPDVAMATADEFGIGVAYANGMVGGIYWDLQDDPEEPGPEVNRSPGASLPGTVAKATPKEAVFLNTHYSDRVRWADPIRDNYGALLEPAGYGVLNVFLDEDVTIEQLTNLGGRRIVHLYSHGVPWPTEDAIQEVYLLTGETFTRDFYDTYWEDVEDGKLGLFLVGKSNHEIAVSPQFISKYNNFGQETVIYGGFCFSFLGGWPEMFAMEDAGGYFGFDWAVYTSYNASWNRDLMATLLNAGEDPPLTVNDWLNNDMAKWYVNDNVDRVVHIRYQGRQMLTLLDDPQPPCAETVIDHPDGYVRGDVHVLVGGAPAAEVPVRVDYEKIHCDGHLGSVGPVTGETGTDGSYAANMLGSFKLDNSQDLIVVRATVYGQSQEKVYRVTAFGGMDGGSIFFPLVAEFSFSF